MPAPLIAAAIAAIAPGLAKQGLDLLSGVFRGAVNKGTEKIANMIEEQTGIDINDVADNKLTDEQWAKLKDFELQNQAQLLAVRQQEDANELERERMVNADRGSARDLQKAALASDDTVAKRFIYFYAAGLTILTFAFIFYAAFIHDYSQANAHAERVIDTVLGFLLGVTLSAIIQYFFGSSAGSKSKEEKLKEFADTLQTEKSQQKGGAQP